MSLAAIIPLCLFVAAAPGICAANPVERPQASAIMEDERRLELRKLEERNRKKPDAKAEKSLSKARPVKKSAPADLLVAPGNLREPEFWRGKFEAGGARLYLWPDNFFVLILEGKLQRDITGWWRQSGDGVELELFNAQDLNIGISRGKKRMYVSLGALGWGAGELTPGEHGEAPLYRAIGRLGKNAFEDMASGKKFALAPGLIQTAENSRPVFASVEIKNREVSRVLSQSRHFPRTYASAANEGKSENFEGIASFAKYVSGKYWLIPPMSGVEKAAIQFLPEEAAGHKTDGKNSENIFGYVEITGPGIRGEGGFTANDGKLSIKLKNKSVKNLVLAGARSLAAAIDGDFSWKLAGAMLTLERDGRSLRLFTSQ